MTKIWNLASFRQHTYEPPRKRVMRGMVPDATGLSEWVTWLYDHCDDDNACKGCGHHLCSCKPKEQPTAFMIPTESVRDMLLRTGQLLLDRDSRLMGRSIKLHTVQDTTKCSWQLQMWCEEPCRNANTYARQDRILADGDAYALVCWSVVCDALAKLIRPEEPKYNFPVHTAIENGQTSDRCESCFGVAGRCKSDCPRLHERVHAKLEAANKSLRSSLEQYESQLVAQVAEQILRKGY